MMTPTASSADITGFDGRNPVRMAAGLFFIALGFSVLSICLFRVLLFRPSSTAFFLLYLSIGMPAGAYLAKRLMAKRIDRVAFMTGSLIVLACVFPLNGWLATRGNEILTDSFIIGFNNVAIWRDLAWRVLVSCPLFVLWGAAEFMGYATALEVPKIARTFYLIFIWGLACAFLLCFWGIPYFGWLRMVAGALLCAFIAGDFFAVKRTVVRRMLPYAMGIAVLFAAGYAEDWYVVKVMPEGAATVTDTLAGKNPYNGMRMQFAKPPAIKAMQWGRYCHIALIETTVLGSGRDTYGALDGIVLWHASPDRTYSFPLEDIAFDLVPENSEIAILGSGGGRQVSMALARSPRSVVAVDIIPEFFSLFTSEYAWMNGGVYRMPGVETVAGDGRNYIRDCGRQFDLIMLPFTESWAGIVKTLFEPGQRLHTTEAFADFASHLKPGGTLAVVKSLDREGILFHRFAASLREAGLTTVGWLSRTSWGPMKFQAFILLATKGERATAATVPIGEFLKSGQWQFVDFQKNPPREKALHDDSPWISGLMGLFFPSRIVTQIVWTIGIVFIVCLALLVFLVFLKKKKGESLPGLMLFMLAGFMLGLNAVYLENGIIFWLIMHLWNPLAAFYVGSVAFLLLLGIGNLSMRWMYVFLAMGIAGIVIYLFFNDWRSGGIAIGAALICVCSGMFFPLLGFHFRERLLLLFVSDSMGGLLGGLLGIWLPVLFGLHTYYAVLPWTSLAAFIACVAAYRFSGRVGQNQ